MHAPRDPAARLGEPLDGRLHVVARSRVQPSHGGNPACVERRQRQDRGRVQPSRKSCIRRRHQYEERQRRQPAAKLRQRRPQPATRPVGIVNHQKRGPARRSRLRQHLPPRIGGAQVGDVQHLAALAVRLGGQLRREPRLAHPARPRDQH